MSKKEITSRTTTKAIITGFVSYGIIFSVICILILNIANLFLVNIKQFNSIGMRITMSIIGAILLYIIMHLLCRVSTFDVFKNCKTSADNYPKIIKNLNIFFVICIILSFIATLLLFYLNCNYQEKNIEYSVLQYNAVFSQDHVNELEKKMIDDFNYSKKNMLISTVIIEIGLAISFVSLFSYQRKMITRYNEVEQVENTSNIENSQTISDNTNENSSTN